MDLHLCFVLQVGNQKEVKRMKRWICSILAVMMLLPVLASTAFAHGHGHSSHHTSTHCTTYKVSKKKDTCKKNDTCLDSCKYADVDGDNICDNCKNKCAECGETKDENADGICDQCGKCSHFLDEDGDGVCDHQEDCANRKEKPKTAGKAVCHTGKHNHHH